MNTRYILLSTFLLFLFCACQNGSTGETSASASDEINPPLEGFNAAASDPQAIAIADEVMEAMGGRQNWDSTHYISWNFFGQRKLVWDKRSGNVRIDIPQEDVHILLNINQDGEGQVMKAGKIIENPDSLQKYLALGKDMWVNDSYWLIMPYKLKDSGVTLNYLGEDITQQGHPADVLQVLFEKREGSPQKKYYIYVDKEQKLVTQWAYYPNAQDSVPEFSTPWADYQQYGSILLSRNRGERSLSEIAVYKELPKIVFTSLIPVSPKE